MAQWTYSQLEQLWINNGGNPTVAPVAAAIALAESGGNDQSLNNNPSTGDYSVGLWQVNYFGSLLSGRTAAYGSPQQLQSDANAQAKAAVSISGNGTNFDPWTTYTSGAYNQYLKAGVQPSMQGAPTINTSASSGSGGSGASAGGGYWGAPYTPSDIPGVPAVIPRYPDASVDPLTDVSRGIAWFTEFAAWGFFIAVVFLLGAVLFVLGLIALIAILAGPAGDAVGAVIGLTGAGKAAKLVGGATAAASSARQTRADNAVRAGTSEPRNRRQANREAEDTMTREGISVRGPADRSTGSERMRREYQTHRGRRVPASASGPAF